MTNPKRDYCVYTLKHNKAVAYDLLYMDSFCKVTFAKDLTNLYWYFEEKDSTKYL